MHIFVLNPPTVRALYAIVNIERRITASPDKYICKVSQQSGNEYTACSRMIHRVTNVQQLTETDKPKRISWFLENTVSEQMAPILYFISDQN